MSIVLPQRTSTTAPKSLAHGYVPVKLQFSAGQRTIVYFADGQHAYASCLRCPDTPCAKFLPQETIPNNFDHFPADRNSETCVTRAITIGANGAPVIDQSRCMFCGVCAIRCPVGAIWFERGSGAVVNDEYNEAFVDSPYESETTLTDLLKHLATIPVDGAMLNENDDLVADSFYRMDHFKPPTGDRFPNMLARNLIRAVGQGASVSRQGNVHMRMDILLSPPGIEHGVVEVEFGQESVLDAPRDILDDLAILVSRYGWTLDSTTALIITDMLPNRRSEYWSIIQDIAQVLGVSIGTVTIFALMLFAWNHLRLDLKNGHPFYVDRGMDSYRVQVLERIVGRPLLVGDSPRPQIDIAK